MEINFDFDFIASHCGQDIGWLRLKFPQRNFEIDQIECRRRFGNKLATLLSHREFMFPTILAGEQSSHEEVARFNSSLVGHPQVAIDLTSGLGVDTMYLAEVSDEVVAIDIDEIKTECLRHNAAVTGKTNINAVNSDCISFLQARKDDNAALVDLIFVDPARRGDGGQRLYSMQDTIPNIIENWDLLKANAKIIMVKASPMLDVSAVMSEVPDLKAVYVVCYKGECKEVLTISGTYIDEGLFAVDINDKGVSKQKFAMRPLSDEKSLSLSQGNPELNELKQDTYIYEPNAAIMKIGRWGELTEMYPGIKKLSTDCHLFHSATLIQDFPGKILKILSIPDKKALKQLKKQRMNVISRNHPLPANKIEEKYSIKSGGNRYLIGCRLKEMPIYLICERV